tara:strand:+ start:78983 stop:80137 length:1155 start_codon:yes stop_codon:yes gene_type:complete
MRIINLVKKAKKFQNFYYEKDILDKITSFRPGEWVQVKSDKTIGIGFINPVVMSGPPLRVCSWKNDTENIEEFIKRRISEAIDYRNSYKHLKKGSRLVYGDADNLPGLIVDAYQNVVLVQINTAGLDGHREFIKEYLKTTLGREVILLDNEKYRASEVLPKYEIEQLPSDIIIEENDIHFHVSSDVVQKIGYYYDHRINRQKLNNWLANSSIEFENGVDLFSYVGSWGLNSLKAGVRKMTFIDQGNFQEAINKNLQINDFEGRGEFIRADVFDWIQKATPRSYDLVISDPPAFKKSSKNRSSAMIGYDKLHRNALKLVKDNGYFVSASCTQDVSLEDLDKSVQSANLENRNLRLLDCGIQGPDHPMDSFQSKAFYIKFLLYHIS